MVESTEPKTNWALLAVCRAVLAFIVLCSHTYNWYGYTRIFRIADLSPFTAVLAFMVLSGYSIHHSYQINSRGFYLRRLERLLPVFAACYLLCLAPYMAGEYYDRWPTSPIGEWPAKEILFGNALCLQGWLVLPIATFGPAWTLGPEVLFYGLAPLLAKLGARTRWGIIWASFLLYCVAPTLGVPLEQQMGTLWVPAQFIWSWLLGWQMYEQRSDSVAITTTLMGMTAVYYHLPYGGSGAALTWAATIMLLWKNSSMGVPRGIKKLCLLAGDSSYALYLSHQPLLTLLSCFYPKLSVYIGVAAALAFSVALILVVERPARRLFARMTYVPTPASSG